MGLDKNMISELLILVIAEKIVLLVNTIIKSFSGNKDYVEQLIDNENKRISKQ